MSQIQHTIIFEGEITRKNVQNLIDTMSNYAYVNLYFSTIGGRLDMMEILIDFLNHRNELGTVRVILYDIIASAGTFLLSKYNGPLFVKELRGFIFHTPDIELPTIRKNHWQKGVEKLLYEENEQFYVFLKDLGLTKSEITKIRAGEDILYFPKDFHKLNVDLVVEEFVQTTYAVVSKAVK